MHHTWITRGLGPVGNRLYSSSWISASGSPSETKPAMSRGAAESNPTTSIVPASSGSAMLNPLDTIPTTTSFAGMSVCLRYCRSASIGWMAPVPGLRVRQDDEAVDGHRPLHGVQHGLGAVGPPERESIGLPHRLVEPVLGGDSGVPSRPRRRPSRVSCPRRRPLSPSSWSRIRRCPGRCASRSVVPAGRSARTVTGCNLSRSRPFYPARKALNKPFPGKQTPLDPSGSTRFANRHWLRSGSHSAASLPLFCERFTAGLASSSGSGGRRRTAAS